MSVAKLYHNKDGSVTISFPFDRVFIENLKEWIPAWSREYHPGNKTWTIGTAYAAEIEPKMRERFGYVEVYGEPVTFNGRSNSTCGCDSAHRMLKVCQDAPPEVVKAAYRALCKQVHPDRGGDHTQMIALTEAYERVTGGVR